MTARGPGDDAPQPNPAQAGGRRYFARRMLTVLIFAAAWRVWIAGEMPCISRDGVRFCWMARDLGREGVALLREPATEQHPLYPVLILAVQRAVVTLSAAAGWAVAETPLLWQRCGQGVAMAGGLAAVVLTALLARSIARRLELGEHGDFIGLTAAGLAAVLPLNVWLSADVMSDELHLALYLSGVWCMVEMGRAGRAFACGVLAGLAFLTRPEGAVVVVGGIAAVLAGRRAGDWGRAARCVAAVGCGFVLCAGPLWWVTGKFTPKKDVGEVFAGAVRVWVGAGILDFGFGILDRGEEARKPELVGTAHPTGFAGRDSGDSGNEKGFSFQRDCGESGKERGFSFQRPIEPVRAVLIERPTAWYGLAPYGLYQAGRAGRLVVPVLALAALWALRRRLRRTPLVGPVACVAVHFTLMLVLLHKWKYLDQRHALVVAGLLIPFAAMALCRICAALAAWVASERVDGRLPSARVDGPPPSARAGGPLTSARVGGRSLGAIAVIVVFVPLTWYSLRIPNGVETYLRDAAAWIAKVEAGRGVESASPPPSPSGRGGGHAAERPLLLSGSSPRRVAFYADLRYQAWPENERSYDKLAEHILHFRPAYFAIEDGPGGERAGNRGLMERLSADGRIAPFCPTIRRFATSRGDGVVLYAFAWPKE